jgi:hypothetical protein
LGNEDFGENTMRMSTTVLAALALAAAASGCATRVGDFTVLSTKNLYAKNVDLTKLPRHTETGYDLTFMGILATPKDAADNALEKGQGNVMTDVVLYRYSSWIPFCSGWKVTGTVMNVPYTRTATAK